MTRWMILPLMLCLCACAGMHQPPQEPYLDRAERALALGKTAYLAASGVYVEARDQGLVEPEEALAIEAVDQQVRAAYAVAAEAIEAGREDEAKKALVRLLGTAQVLVDALAGVLPYDADRAVRIALIIMGRLI